MTENETDSFEDFAEGLRGKNNLEEFMASPEEKKVIAKEDKLGAERMEIKEAERFNEATKAIAERIKSLQEEKEPRLNFLNAKALSDMLNSYIEESENYPDANKKFKELKIELFRTNPNLRLKEEILEKVYLDVTKTTKTDGSLIYRNTEEIIEKLFSTKEFNRDIYKNGVIVKKLKDELIDAIIETAKNLANKQESHDLTPELIKSTLKGAIGNVHISRPDWKSVEESAESRKSDAA